MLPQFSLILESGVPSWSETANKTPKRYQKLKLVSPFWSHFSNVFVFCGCPFFDVCLVLLFYSIFVHLHAKVAPKRGLLGDILVTIWRPWRHPWKVCFLTTLLHFSSIPPSHASSQISLFGCCFWYPLWEALEDDIFADFDDFGLHGGTPGEPIFRLLADFLVVPFLVQF
jgi:hypothetical protein